MKKLYYFLIPLLLSIFIGSCAEKPTILESDSSEDIYQLYLEKSKVKPLEMSFEEFASLVNKQRSLSKSSAALSSTSPPSWDSEYGTNLNLGDDYSVEVAIGFDFEFFGEVFSSVWVNSNGNLSLNTIFTDYEITMPMQINVWNGSGFDLIDVALVGVIAGDFNPSAGGAVYYKTVGDAPDRRFVATWEVVPEYSQGGMNTFQVQLFEGSNVIQFGYNGLTTDGIDWLNQNMEVGLSYASDQLVLAAAGNQIPDLDGFNICFTPEGGTYIQSDELCNVEVPLMEQKADVIAALQALMPSGEKTDKKLEKAVEKIQKSLDPENWVDDNHLDEKKGKKVFDEEKKAVKELKNIVKDKHGDPLLQAAVSTIIGTLVSIDEQLALKALSEIEGACVTEKCGKEIEKAYKELGKAAEEIAKEHWDHVIDKYKKAWEHTQHAVKENTP